MRNKSNLLTHSQQFPLTKFFKKLDRFLRTFEELVIAYGIITIALVMIGNVIGRSLFNRSWVFVEEFCEVSIILVTFVGTGYAVRKGRHIRMSALYDLLKPKVRKALIIIISFITSSVMFFLAYHAIRYTIQIKAVTATLPSLNMPTYLVYAWVPFGLFIAGIEYLFAIYTNLVKEDVFLSSEKTDSYEEEHIQIMQCESPTESRTVD